MKYKHNAMWIKSLVAGLISAMVSCGHFAYGDTLPVSAMDDDMFSFYCDDDSCSVVEGEGLSGGNALSCEGWSWLSVDGPSSSGTLTFNCRYDSDSGENGYGYLWVYDGDDDSYRGFRVNSAGNWKSYSVDVFADESNPVCITFEGEVEKGRILISDFVWTPAPETVKISFHTRGGNNLAPIVAKPGSWVDLPAAVHAGWTFLHWTSMSHDTVRNEGLGWRYRAGLTDVDFYANWGLPISAADRDWVSYSTNGLWKIYSTAIGDESADSNVMFLCELGEYGKEVEEAFKPQISTQDLKAAVTGPAKFAISHCIYDYDDFSLSNVEFSVLLDGVTKVSYKLDSQDIETQMKNMQRTATVVGVPQGAHTLTIRFAGVPDVRSGWIYDDEEGDYKEANVLDGPTLSVKIESIPTAPKATFSEWATACKEGSFWSVGDLDRFAEEYASRIEKDNADYEARILHAVTLLAKLCESESLAGFCKAFGCTLDYFGMKVDGKLSAPVEWPSMNDMVDQFVKEAVPAIKGALQDLEAIPSGWTGTVKLKSSEYPVDEDIEVDIGDVLYARAGLSAILGLGYFAHAYDLSVDWVKAKEAFESRLTIPLLEPAPSLSSDAGWQNALSTRDGGARLAFGPDKKMYVRIEDEKYISALRNEGYLSLKLARRDGVDPESLLVYYDRYYGYYNDDNYGPVRSAFLIYGLEHRELPVQVKELQDAVIIEFDMSNPYVSKLCSGNVWYYVAGTLGFDSGLIELSANNPFLFVANNFIAEQSAFMSEVRNAASLETSKAWMRSAMSTALSADAAVLARVDDSMHAVEYDAKDNESINKARGLVRKALASIDGVQTLDVASEVLREGDDFDVSLLPSGGLMKVYLGALFSGKIKRDLLPTFAVDSDEKLVPIVESINDSTVGGLLPEFTMLTWNQLATNFGIKVEHRELAIKFDANGGVVSPTSRAATLGEAVGALPAPTREGYAFRGWFTAASEGEIIKPDTVVTGAITLYAHWTANPYKVRFNANGGAGAMVDQAYVYGTSQKLSANAFSRKMYAFIGWALSPDGAVVFADGQTVGDLATVVNSIVTLYAVWEEAKNELWSDVVEGAVSSLSASEYNGYLYDELGAMMGTIQVKVGMPNAKTGLATVKATVQLGAKKVTLKAEGKGGVQIAADGPTAIGLVGVEPCTVVLGSDGVYGFYGNYEIDGARNFFTSKNKGEQNAANAVLGKWLGGVSILADVGNFTVTISAKGKAKVSGTLANGKKATGNAVFLVGEEWACVPVVLPKANISFALWLPLDGGEAVVTGLGDDVVAGHGGALKAGAAFRIDKDEFAAVTGIAALPYLPDGVSVEPKGTKWAVVGGAKAGKVAYRRGTQEIDEAKLGDNPSGLKLTYKAKDGSFKGSFKVYAEVKGKLKATTVSVSGIVLNGIGYGTATVKGKGSVPVTIE